VLVSSVFFHLLYAAKTWTIKLRDYRKLLPFEILKVCWQKKVSNKTISEKVERHCTLVDLIKQKAKLPGHSCKLKD